MWITPVFDRTQGDVDDRTPKGYRNVSDVNRIESNTDHVSQLFRAPVSALSWTMRQFPSARDYQRIIDNIRTVRDKSGVMNVTIPALPLNTWQKMNEAEKALFDIYTYYNRIEQMKIYTTEAYAGQTIGVI
jgi:hypothetical protein